MMKTDRSSVYIAVVWNVPPYSLRKVYKTFIWSCCSNVRTVHLQRACCSLGKIV